MLSVKRLEGVGSDFPSLTEISSIEISFGVGKRHNLPARYGTFKGKFDELK